MKLTEEITGQIETLVRAGVSKSIAGQSLGLTGRTINNWIKWGREGNETYKDFSERVEKASAECEAKVVRTIYQQADKDWRAGSWWLSKRRAKVYGDKLEVAGGIDLGKDEMTDEEMVAKVTEILEGLNDGTDGRKP